MNRPNILLLILDSARAENMSVYGHERETTPFLERFAQDATVYTQARAPSIHSISSHTSIFTGQHVHEHRAVEHDSNIHPRQTIWKKLSDQYGYATGLFTANSVITESSNLSDSFQHCHSPPRRARNRRARALFDEAYRPGDVADVNGPIEHGLQCLASSRPLRSFVNCGWRFGVQLEERVRGTVNVNTRPGHEFTEAFLDWEEEKSEPWAACINLMDTHMPYVPEQRFNKWEGRASEDLSKNKPDVPALLQEGGWETLTALEDLYDGTIRQADYIIQNLLNRLSDKGEYEEMLIIVTSDHGEAFGEQGQVDPEIRLVGHGWGIHEVLTHVPLLVKWPRQRTGTTVTDVTSLTDLPEMMSKTLSSGTMDSYVSDGPVLASTFRMPPRVVSKLEYIDEIDRYRGPWRATYENEKGHIRKYASRRGSYVTVDSYSANQYEVSDRTRHDKTRGMFGDVSYEDVYGDNKRGISEELEDQLADLGYM